jgi:hypothetical protein
VASVLRRLGLVLALACASSGCAAGAYYEAAEKMRTINPHAAIDYVSLALAEDPDHEKTIDLISELGSRIRDDHRERIETLEKNGQWEEAVAQCDRVIASADVVAHLPHGIQIYHDPEERTRFAKRAAKKFYDQARKLEDEKHGKEAAIAYRRALGFVTNFEDALDRYQRAQKGATVRVAVIGFEAADPHGRALCQPLARGTLASCIAKNPEFLQVVPKEKLDDSCTGKLVGTVEAARFTDSNWVAHPGRNETTKRVKGKDGLYYDKRVECTWVVYDRQTRFELTASYQVEDAKTGAALAAAKSSKSAGDSKKYIQVHGDEEALPSELEGLPRTPVEPSGQQQLGTICAEQVSDELGLELFKAFK